MAVTFWMDYALSFGNAIEDELRIVKLLMEKMSSTGNWKHNWKPQLDRRYALPYGFSKIASLA